MSRKVTLSLLLLICLVGILSKQVFASSDLLKPNSRFYFLQTWKENIVLSLKLSKESKFEYLLTLTEKRVEDMEEFSNPAITRLYEKHYQYLDRLAAQMENKEEVTAKIRENSLHQQIALAKVYTQVSEPAKEAILNAQENSADQVARTIERVEGAQNAQEYIQKVALIQQMEQADQVEQILQESSPHADPAQSTPQSLRENRETLPGKELNPINPNLEEQEGGSDGGGKMETVVPAQMNQPTGRN